MSCQHSPDNVVGSRYLLVAPLVVMTRLVFALLHWPLISFYQH